MQNIYKNKAILDRYTCLKYVQKKMGSRYKTKSTVFYESYEITIVGGGDIE